MLSGAALVPLLPSSAVERSERRNRALRIPVGSLHTVSDAVGVQGKLDGRGGTSRANSTSSRSLSVNARAPLVICGASHGAVLQLNLFRVRLFRGGTRQDGCLFDAARSAPCSRSRCGYATAGRLSVRLCESLSPARAPSPAATRKATPVAPPRADEPDAHPVGFAKSARPGRLNPADGAIVLREVMGHARRPDGRNRYALGAFDPCLRCALPGGWQGIASAHSEQHPGSVPGRSAGLAGTVVGRDRRCAGRDRVVAVR